MKKALKKHLPLLSLLLLLLAWGLWYSRPVGVETLFPDMEPDLLDVMLIGSDDGIESRSLKLEPGTENFDALWKALQELRFRRSPLNPIKQVLPFLDSLTSQAKQFEHDDITHMDIMLAQNNGQAGWRYKQLRFWVDSWAYRDMDRRVELALWMQDSKAVGQELAHRLWEQAGN